MACKKANLPISIINPAHIKKFAGAIGRLAKKDKLDAQLISMQTMEKNRLTILPKTLHKSVNPLLKILMREIEKVDMLMNEIIENNPEYQAKNTIIQSMPGVGKVVAFSLLSNMPELGYITNKQAASLIGVAPINRESGTY